MSEATYHLALPPSGKGPGVLVLHPWWGLNDFMKEFCNRLSRKGFVVLAPDLYHGQVAQTIAEAETLRGKMKRPQAAEEILTGLSALRATPKIAGPEIGVIGFSLGAFFGLRLAAEHPQDIRAVAVFYGASGQEFTSSQAAFLGHFAENDPYQSTSGVRKMEKNLTKAGRPVSFFTYPGTGHWFFESDRPDAFNPEAAQLAWTRTIEFLHRNLG